MNIYDLHHRWVERKKRKQEEKKKRMEEQITQEEEKSRKVLTQKEELPTTDGLSLQNNESETTGKDSRYSKNMRTENKYSILSVQTLIELSRTIKRNILQIILVVTVFTGLAALYIFSIPREYTSTTIMLPEINNGGLSGALGDLSSMIGMKNKTDADAISPEYYPQVISSTEFQTDLFGAKIKFKNKWTTIYDYFLLNQKEPWWASKKKKEKLVPYSADVIDPTRFNKQQEGISKTLDGAILCMVDKKSDMITISVNCQDPYVAQQIASIVKVKLQNYITAYRTRKARNDVEYFQKLYNESKAKYVKIRRAYAAFSDANEDVILPSVQSKQEDMENDMQLKYNVFTQMSNQLQQAQAKLQERTPAFTTIQEATVPIKPSSPKRMVFVIFAFFASFFGDLFFILLRKSIKQNIKAEREDHEDQ